MADNIHVLSAEDAAGINADLDQQEEVFDDLEDGDLEDGDPDIRQRRNRSAGWAKTEHEDENLPSRVGSDAASLFWSARIRSSRLMEDGIISVSDKRVIATAAGLSLQGFTKASARLIEAGNWEARHDSNGELVGWKDLGFLTWNAPRVSRERQRGKWRAEGRQKRNKAKKSR